ncbi:methylated-DNA--[protein]-cysteine S-methyltransferase [Limnoglobus roseus]|uniref:Methylated-DNA--protein-cysteine methyltransferase n=1 Tax=Limnoglobus roseus TaxID=2598579 RepID=A0A5C1AJF4_9BACT|nr:methylated-DNA--[protein]-cysteine S-methyltransferase [Limnoglobus roseus]QEL17264.1 glycosyltransferase [Limnoglobus roseus]
MLTLTKTYYDTLSGPLGDVLLTSDGEHLTGLWFAAEPPADAVRERATFKSYASQLRAYLAGELRAFDLPMRQSGTPFQERVWTELQAIPYGETISYAELARRIGQPTASRAVGSANGRNNISIVVPCHRVIAADGTLGGYGGELWRKEWLLKLEGVNF